ncbi:MAG TPA: J domain-containing protein, partial [Kofleriaceae bacterium]|nr:J domain-containing protein [Kofleriaceae bacterium]
MSQAPINIKLRCASWQQLANIYRRDLARHAIFLKSSTPPPLGTAVRIDLTLPTESMIVLTGSVAEHVGEGGLGGRGPGIDIKLNTIPQSALWLIETALASAQKQPGATAAAPAAAPAAPAEAADDEGRDLADAEGELLTALTSELTSLRKLNPFQVMGVGYEATDEDVRGAFAELTKRYHPDRFTRYTSTDLRTLAAEIFILIRDAYGKLNDEASRARVLATLGARPAVRVPTLKPPRPTIPPIAVDDRPPPRPVPPPPRAATPPPIP